jgi:uroporphyrinogen decarboxylase
MALMTACISGPEIITAIVEKGINHNIMMVEQAAKLGAEFVLTGDDIADNRSTLISLKMWEEIFQPYFRRLSEAFHGLGLYYWKHSDGNLMSVMDSLISAGIDGIDPVDPLGGMSLRVMKEKYGDKVAIKGNVDCANLLVSGTPQQVANSVTECIRVAGPGGGYVCSSSNSIHSGVNPDLYKTMVDAINEINICVDALKKHYFVSFGCAASCVTGQIVLTNISFDFDNFTNKILPAKFSD